MNKRQKIIGITGMPGVGKSTLGAELAKRMKCGKWLYTHYECSGLFFESLFEKHLETGGAESSDIYYFLKINCNNEKFGGLFRKFLQDIGAKSREHYPNLLLDSMKKCVAPDYWGKEYDIVFTGIRDKEHADWILAQGGVLFHILPGDFYLADDRVADHKVEVSVPYPGSCIITNNNIITSVNEMICYLEGFYGQD